VAHSCTIRRLHLSLLAPRDHPEPEALRARVADAVAGALETSLAQALGDLPGEGVLRIGRMEIDLSLDAALSPEATAERLAESVAESIRRARDDGAQIWSFPDRAHYRAAFLRELVRGTAWQRWWFKSFDGVKPLALTAAVRTCLAADPREGIDALAAMPEHERVRVLSVLSAADAASLIRGLTAGVPDVDVEDAVEALVSARRQSSLDGSAQEPRIAALFTLVRLVLAERRNACGRVAALVLALADLDHVLARMTTAKRTVLLGDLAEAGEVARPEALTPDLLARLAPLVALPRAIRERLLETARVQQPAAPSADALRHTPFGGLFLLLPSLDWAELQGACAGAEWDDDKAAPEALIALLTIAACAGRPRASALLADGCWRDVLAVPSADIAARLATLPEEVWAKLSAAGCAPLNRTDARHLLLPERLCGSRAAAKAIARLARALLDRFARRLPGARASSAPFLWSNLFAAAATVRRDATGWQATLARPPLDVLLSLSGIAQDSVILPGRRRLVLEREPS
jgi:hypothetical protein